MPGAQDRIRGIARLARSGDPDAIKALAWIHATKKGIDAGHIPGAQPDEDWLEDDDTNADVEFEAEGSVGNGKPKPHLGHGFTFKGLSFKPKPHLGHVFKLVSRPAASTTPGAHLHLGKMPVAPGLKLSLKGTPQATALMKNLRLSPGVMMALTRANEMQGASAVHDLADKLNLPPGAALAAQNMTTDLEEDDVRDPDDGYEDPGSPFVAVQDTSYDQGEPDGEFYGYGQGYAPDEPPRDGSGYGDISWSDWDEDAA